MITFTSTIAFILMLVLFLVTLFGVLGRSFVALISSVPAHVPHRPNLAFLRERSTYAPGVLALMLAALASLSTQGFVLSTFLTMLMFVLMIQSMFIFSIVIRSSIKEPVVS